MFSHFCGKPQLKKTEQLLHSKSDILFKSFGCNVLVFYTYLSGALTCFRFLNSFPASLFMLGTKRPRQIPVRENPKSLGNTFRFCHQV